MNFIQFLPKVIQRHRGVLLTGSFTLYMIWHGNRPKYSLKAVKIVFVLWIFSLDRFL